MGGDNDRIVDEPCAVDCKLPHAHTAPHATDATDELGRPVPPIDERGAPPDGDVTYLDEPPMVDASGELGIRRRSGGERP